MANPEAEFRPFLSPDDQRAAALAELAALPVVSGAGGPDTARIRDWLATAPQICRIAPPDMPPVHLVVYAVIAAEGALVLGHHRKSGRWLPCGGHVDVGEHPRDAARREMAEELGLCVPSLGPPHLATWLETVGTTAGHVDVTFWYGLRLSSCGALAFDRAEFAALDWFHPEDIPPNTDPNLSAFLAAWGRV